MEQVGRRKSSFFQCLLPLLLGGTLVSVGSQSIGGSFQTFLKNHMVEDANHLTRDGNYWIALASKRQPGVTNSLIIGSTSEIAADFNFPNLNTAKKISSRTLWKSRNARTIYTVDLAGRRVWRCEGPYLARLERVQAGGPPTAGSPSMFEGTVGGAQCLSVPLSGRADTSPTKTTPRLPAGENIADSGQSPISYSNLNPSAINPESDSPPSATRAIGGLITAVVARPDDGPGAGGQRSLIEGIAQGGGAGAIASTVAVAAPGVVAAAGNLAQTIAAKMRRRPKTTPKKTPRRPRKARPSRKARAAARKAKQAQKPARTRPTKKTGKRGAKPGGRAGRPGAKRTRPKGAKPRASRAGRTRPKARRTGGKARVKG